MLHTFHELWREGGIHLNHMVGNQTDFHKGNYFLADIQTLNLIKIFSRIFPRIGNKETVLCFCKSCLSPFL